MNADDLRDVKAALFDLNNDNDPANAIRDFLQLLVRRLPKILEQKKALLESLTGEQMQTTVDGLRREDREDNHQR